MKKYRLGITLSAIACFVFAGDWNSAWGQAKGTQTMKTDSILLKPWSGPYGGVPPWRQVNPDEFLGAFDAAIEMSTKEINEIANNPEPPSFDNTFVALEKAGKPLERVQTIFDVYSSNLKLGSIPDIEKAVAPKLSKHFDSITQNEKLFARMEQVYQSDEMTSLTNAQKRLAKDRYEEFVRRGAKLNVEQKAKLSQINSALAGLFADFGQRVMNDEGGWVTWIKDKEDLQGLPESTIAAMETSAKELQQPGEDLGQWCVTNTRSSMDPFLTYADNRALREEVWRNYYNRGDNGDEQRQQRNHHGHSETASRTRLVAGLQNACALATGTANGSPAGSRDGLDAEGLAQSRRPRQGRSRRHAGNRRRRRGRDHDRALGLSLLRRKSSQRQIRSGFQRGQTVPATGKTPRRHDVGRRAAVRF